MSREAIKHLSGGDRVMGGLIRRVGAWDIERVRKPDRLRGSHGPYAALVEAVVYQQLSGKAAAAILGRVKALFPGRRFPLPEDLLRTPEETLRGAGLSRAKTAAVKDIASKRLEGVVPTTAGISKMDDEAIIERLVTIRGVGRWTVEMLLIFMLGREDVLPASDYGIRKGFALTYGLEDLPSQKELLERGERWRPYRTMASWYLWRSLEL